jgi:transposase InsO family protein
MTYKSFQQVYRFLGNTPRYPVVDTLTSLTAKSVIPLLDKTFSIFGIPKELKSDNGPPFNSQEFRKFADNIVL